MVVGRSHHPLRCGAVLRSGDSEVIGYTVAVVIIPCVAGQFFEGYDAERRLFKTLAVIIPCVAGQFFEGGTFRPMGPGASSVIIPCVAGQFFEGRVYEESCELSSFVIIPCVAGQFFEVETAERRPEFSLQMSSSPALRGSSSKLRREHRCVPPSARHHPLRCGAVLRSEFATLSIAYDAIRVIIPCVAGQFFEVSDLAADSPLTYLQSHHPLRCGAVLRRRMELVAGGSSLWSSSPALRGSSSKESGLIGMVTRSLTSHHPLRCGAVLRSRIQQLNRAGIDVIIPCVAGQFFEGQKVLNVQIASTESSSPALRGSSSKATLQTAS